jgi:phosphotransferase system HPr-like phosphotransfer protein
VDASDVVELLSLGAGQGTELVLAAKGADAEATLDALVQLFDNDFGLSGGHAGD